MSHWTGTAYVARRSIFATQDELDAAWRTSGSDRACVCDPPRTMPIELDPDYAGVRWSSAACLRCMTITGPRSEPEP